MADLLMHLDNDGLPYLTGRSNSATNHSPIGLGDREVKTGTTIVGCIYNSGLILAADSRTSAGSYVVNRAARKISRVSNNIFVCRSGSAADTQALTQILKFQLQQYKQQLPRQQYPQEPEVKVAATLLKSVCYKYKDVLTAGLIVGGLDYSYVNNNLTNEGAQDPVITITPELYSVPLGGALVPVQYTAGGSGSVYITAYMDDHYEPNMSKEECVKMLTTAVSHAISRDGSSGGMIRVIIMDKETGTEEFCIKGNELLVKP